jgi:hypothetical protein
MLAGPFDPVLTKILLTIAADEGHRHERSAAGIPRTLLP